MASWNYQLVDNHDGSFIAGFVNPRERQYSKRLKGIRSCGFSVDVTDPAGKKLLDRKGAALIKAYRDSSLQLVGDPVKFGRTGDESGAQKIVVQVQDPVWRLTKRILGTSLIDLGATGGGAVVWNNQRQLVMEGVLSELNLSYDTGIRNGTANDVLSAAVTDLMHWKNAAEFFREWGQTVGFGYTLPTPVIADPFSGFTGNLQGRTPPTAPSGTTWNTSGSVSTDYDGDSVQLRRGVTNDLDVVDGSNTGGRVAKAISGSGTFFSNVFVQVEFQFGPTPTGGRQGVLARHLNFSGTGGNYAMAYRDHATGQIAVRKRIDNTETELGRSAAITIPVNQWWTMMFQIDSTGRWAVWVHQTGTTPTAPTLVGNDASFEAGGQLDGGHTGVYDQCHSATGASPLRFYRNFKSGPLPAPIDLQGLDWEVVPVEPVADTLQRPAFPSPITVPALKIAVLNVKEKLGVDRPHAVFDYGGGSARTYEYLYDRDKQLTRAFVLAPDPANPDIQIGKVAKDQIARDTYGLMEEVVSADFQSDSLRQAWADANVAARSEPPTQGTFTPPVIPTANTPIWPTDYDVGDTVRVHVAEPDGTTALWVSTRVFGVDVAIDDEDRETVNPVLVSES